MLALRKTQPAFGAELVDIALPDRGTPGPGEARVRVAAAGICGSDLHAFEWTPGYEFMERLLPVTFGHEFAGTIEALGEGVEGLEPGDRVTCWPTLTCGDCPGCRSGAPLCCENRRIVGLHRDGGFAARVTVPARVLRRLPEGLDLGLAALTEPLAVAVHAVDTADIAPGDRVAVLGPGPIGLAAAFVAARRGAKVMVAGFEDAPRLAVARTMGAAHVADLAEAPLANAVQAAFGSRIDRVIEATGVASSVEDGLAVLRPGGILVAAGIHARPVSLDLTRLVREKKQLRGAHDTTEAAFAAAMALLVAEGATLGALVTHRLPLGRALEAMALARSRQAVKVMLTPDEEIR
ncbi:alcohol dehydrogenase catalytic domain-containing protein [Frigidibacter sp. MR17.14]|uniref:zinc-dependent alcohol dehydrogenase n=1 Tax=Frigidibacter sp. MR17.14 TaxID=3126509 RepID=UPI003012C9A1